MILDPLSIYSESSRTIYRVFLANNVKNKQTPLQTIQTGPGKVVSQLLVKQASHWHDKRFTRWYAIWRANEGRTRESVRGDAWRWSEVVRSGAQNFFEGVTTCREEIVMCTCVTLECHAFREQFVTYRWQMARYGPTWRKLCVTLPSLQTSCH